MISDAFDAGVSEFSLLAKKAEASDTDLAAAANAQDLVIVFQISEDVESVARSHPDGGGIVHGQNEVEDAVLFRHLTGGDAGPDDGREEAAPRARPQDPLCGQGLQRAVRASPDETLEVGQSPRRTKLLDDARSRPIEPDENHERPGRFAPATAEETEDHREEHAGRLRLVAAQPRAHLQG